MHVAASRGSYGGIRILLTLFALICVAMALTSAMLPLVPGVALIFAGMGLLGMGNGTVFQLVPHRFPREMGVITGLVGAAGGIGGFLLPFLLGTLKDLTGSYGAGFLLFALAAGTAAGLLMVSWWWSWRKTWASHGSHAYHGSKAIVSAALIQEEAN